MGRPAPAKVAVPTYWTSMLFELREHDTRDIRTPVFTFSKPAGSVLRMNSTTSSIGTGYVLRNFNREWLHGKTISMMSRASKSWAAFNNAVYIYDGHYDGESQVDFPDDAHIVPKGAGILQIMLSHDGSYGWTEDSAVADTSVGTEEECCLLFRLRDAWDSQWGWVEYDWVKVSGGDPLQEAIEHFTDSVNMITTGTNHDYGTISEGGPP